MTHTPGPLTINGPSPGGSDMDDGGDYAIVTGDQIIGEAIRKTAPSTFQPAEANARLWAASPDLLAALRRIFNGFEETGSWPLWATHQSFNGDPAEVSAWEQARAAISKAE